MPVHVCPECARTFHSMRADAVSCGATCRKRAERRRAAYRTARVRELLLRQSATIREGMALLDLDAVRPELDRIAAELDAFLP